TGLCPAPTCASERFDKIVPSPLLGGVNGLNTDAAGAPYGAGGFGRNTDPADLGGATLTNNGRADADVGQGDPATGEATWAKRFGDAADQSGAGVTEDGAGHVVVMGNFTGALTGSTPAISATFDALFIMGLDSATGNGVWAKTINLSGGLGGGSLFAIATDP